MSNKYLTISLEEIEGVVSQALSGDENHDLVIVESHQQLVEAINDVEKLQQANDAMTAIVNVTSGIDGDNVSVESMDLIRECLNTVRNTTGIRITVSQEGAVGDFFAKVWEAIKRVFGAISNFIKGLFSKTKAVEAKTEDATKKVKDLIEKAKASPDKKLIVRFENKKSPMAVLIKKEGFGKLSNKLSTVGELAKIFGDISNEMRGAIRQGVSETLKVFQSIDDSKNIKAEVDAAIANMDKESNSKIQDSIKTHNEDMREVGLEMSFENGKIIFKKVDMEAVTLSENLTVADLNNILTATEHMPSLLRGFEAIFDNLGKSSKEAGDLVDKIASRHIGRNYKTDEQRKEMTRLLNHVKQKFSEGTNLIHATMQCSKEAIFGIIDINQIIDSIHFVD